MSGIASDARRLPVLRRPSATRGHRGHLMADVSACAWGATPARISSLPSSDVRAVTYYTLFVIDLASRRIQIVGSTPYPDALFMRQVGRTLTAAEDGLLRDHRVLISDRDRKWSRDVRRLLEDEGIRVVQTPYQAPNANAHAERFVRSIKEECLDRIIPIGERHFRRAVTEFVAHYHHERNHQGLANALIDDRYRPTGRRIRRRPRCGSSIIPTGG